MISRRFFHFCVAGTLGFSVDAALTQALVSFASLHPLSARVVAVVVAMLTTWQYNRHVTFHDRRPMHVLAELARYLAANALGLAVNYGAYALTLALWPLTRQWPVLAVAAGSIAGMGVNYLSAHAFVFRPTR